MPKWTEYTTKETLADNDEVMLYDATARANKRGLMSKFWNYVVDKMATAVISKLETNNKTIIGAINALNSENKVSGHSKTLSKNETWTLNVSYNCILMFSPVNDGFVVVIVNPNEYHCVYGENLMSTASISAVNNVIKITNLIDWPVCFNLIGI